MQKIQEYSKWIIDKVFRFFGEQAYQYESKSIHRLKTQITFTEGIYKTEQSRYEHLMNYLEDEALITVLHLAVAQYLFPEFYHMLKGLTGQSTTLALALRLTGEEHRWTYPQLKKRYDRLREYLCLETRAENFLYRELFADERLVLYLAGDNTIAGELIKSCELYLPFYQDIYKDTEQNTESDKIRDTQNSVEDNPHIDKYTETVYRQLSQIRKKTGKYILQLCGEDGRGKKTILKTIAKYENTGWVFVNYNRLRIEAGKELIRYIWLIKREAALYGFGICYEYTMSEQEEDFYQFIEKCLEQNLNYASAICVCTDEKTELIPHTILPIHKIVLPDCERQERIAIWRKLSEDNNLKLDYEKYGAKYFLNPGDIKKIFDGLWAVYHTDMPEEETDRLVAELCVNVRNAPRKGSIKRTISTYTMEDLKLKKEHKETLENICAYVRYSHKVYDIWNMETKYAYGKNVTALFYGPPGTGKTMAANILSNELKMPLYRIDLSQVVDKYIGETEKRLEEIFTYADKSNVILFFDEADAIFGKRMEVKEAKDRYANTEVSYILQRIEQYNGIVLLATNFKNNIDEAFMRRMKYAVEFEMPDTNIRKEIWMSGFSRDVPLENIDFDYLAERVELSGGYIKNIILNAVFLGAKEGNKVTMKHILSSVRNEYIKMGKVLGPQDFGKYAYYF